MHVTTRFVFVKLLKRRKKTNNANDCQMNAFNSHIVVCCWRFDVHQLIRENECHPTTHPCEKDKKIYFHNRKGLWNGQWKNFSVLRRLQRKFETKRQHIKIAVIGICQHRTHQEMSSSLLLKIHLRHSRAGGQNKIRKLTRNFPVIRKK